MPRKTKFDPNAAFNSIIVPMEPEQSIGDESGTAKVVAPAPAENIETDNVKDVSKEKKLVQKAYYITPEEYKALKIRAATDDMDMSQIVRDALDRYFFLGEYKN